MTSETVEVPAGDGERRYRVVDVHGDAEAAFEAAADAVAAGEVIVLPTDTVYGVGADPFSPAAVQRLLDAKRRGRDMPPPVLVAEVDVVRSLVVGIDDRAEAIARAFWPGALTIVGTAPDSLRMDLGDRGATIAVRVPDDDFTRELLRRTGPLAVSSANVSGSEAALTIEDAVAQLGDSVSVYLDAGTMSGPVPSTILDLSTGIPRLLREGRISAADLNAVVPGLLPDPDPASDGLSDEAESADDEASEQAGPTEQAVDPGTSTGPGVSAGELDGDVAVTTPDPAPRADPPELNV